MMNTFFTYSAIGLSLLLLFPMLRALMGPTVIDRIVGVNVMGTKATVLIIFVGMLYGRVEMFVDIAIAYAMLNFIVSIAAAKLFHRYRSIEPVNNDVQREGLS